MDELEISGKRYISSRRAAKENKYHSDYIGQLIRAGKVVGQKVGRSWYVEVSSLDAYLRGEGVVPQSAELSAPVEKLEEEKHEEVPAPVEHIPQPQTKVSDEPYKIPIRPIKKIEEKAPGLTYVPDETPLVPVIEKETKVPVVKVEVREVELKEEIEEESEKVTREYVPQVMIKKPKPYLEAGVGLSILGVLTFFAVSGVAYLLNYLVIVEGDEVTASVSIGLER